MDKERIHFSVWMEKHQCEFPDVPEEHVFRVWRLCFKELESVKEDAKQLEERFLESADEISALIQEIGMEFGFPLRDYFVEGLKDIKRQVASIVEEVRGLRESANYARHGVLRGGKAKNE